MIPINFARGLLVGYGIDFTDQVVVQSSPKVDALYGDEAIGLQFSSTPEQIKTDLKLGQNLTWNALRVAHEFHNEVVKFVNLHAKTANTALRDWGLCISSVDDVVLFFGADGRHELFRVSLRFWASNECPGPEAWLNYFADSVGADISDREDGRFFNAQGSSTYIMGWSNPPLTIVDIGKLGFPSPSIGPEDWLRFIAEDLRKP